MSCIVTCIVQTFEAVLALACGAIRLKVVGGSLRHVIGSCHEFQTLWNEKSWFKD